MQSDQNFFLKPLRVLCFIRFLFSDVSALSVKSTFYHAIQINDPETACFWKKNVGKEENTGN